MSINRRRLLMFGLPAMTIAAAGLAAYHNQKYLPLALGRYIPARPAPYGTPEPWAVKLSQAAFHQIGVTVAYDAAYHSLPYPNGDVPLTTGVCSDVIIRAYRNGLGLDLQKLVHEDMVQNFSAYPKLWGLKKPDANIDHRRVPNLQCYFQRHQAEQPISNRIADYHPGDIITLGGGDSAPHIALVSHFASADGQRPLLIHNVGQGTEFADFLLLATLSGHYRFSPDHVL